MSASRDRMPFAVGVGSVLDGRLELLRPLGEGGMGAVYLAANVKLRDVLFAVKVLRPEVADNERFVRWLESEARTQSVLKHDNIVRVFELLTWRGQQFLILDYVEGQTLKQRIQEHPRGLPMGEALALACEILRALNHAHEHGVLHCDVKPANVLLGTGGRAHITDFGIARNLRAAGSDHVVGGSPEYMSPEQDERRDPIDHRTDVFSAGVTLFEMLTGRLPYEPEEEPAHRRAAGPLMRLKDARPDLPGGLDRIVAKSMERSRSLRYQGCLEFLAAIERYRLTRRWRRIGIAIAISCLVLGTAAAVKMHLDDLARQERERVEAIRAKELLAQQRTAIAAAINNGINNLFSLCRDAKRLDEKTKGLATARQYGMQDLVARFEAQNRDIEANLDGYAKAYGEAVTSLTRFGPPLVQRGFDDFSQASPDDAWLKDAIRRDVAARATSRTRASLRGDCVR